RVPVAVLSTRAAGAPATSIPSTLGAPCSSFQPMSTGSSADIGLGTQVTVLPAGATPATPSPAGASRAPSGSPGRGPPKPPCGSTSVPPTLASRRPPTPAGPLGETATRPPPPPPDPTDQHRLGRVRRNNALRPGPRLGQRAHVPFGPLLVCGRRVDLHEHPFVAPPPVLRPILLALASVHQQPVERGRGQPAARAVAELCGPQRQLARTLIGLL